MKGRATHQKTVIPAKAGIQPSRHPRAPLSGVHHAVIPASRKPESINIPSPRLRREGGGEGRNSLPHGWVKKSLGDVVTVIRGIRKSFRGKASTLDNAIHALLSRNIVVPKEGERGTYKLLHKGFGLWILFFTTKPSEVQELLSTSTKTEG